ncbi:MAG: hypothetical protein ACFFEY_16265 [Candidatus Thorarchaeota archaeon]
MQQKKDVNNYIIYIDKEQYLQALKDKIKKLKAKGDKTNLRNYGWLILGVLMMQMDLVIVQALVVLVENT